MATGSGAVRGLGPELFGRVEELGFELVGDRLQAERLRASAEAQTTAGTGIQIQDDRGEPGQGFDLGSQLDAALGAGVDTPPAGLAELGHDKGFGSGSGLGLRHILPFQIYSSPHIER